MRHFKLFTWTLLAGSFVFSGTALNAQDRYWNSRDIHQDRQDLRNDRRDLRHDDRRIDRLRYSGAHRYSMQRDLREARHDRRDIYHDRRNLRNDSRSYWQDR